MHSHLNIWKNSSEVTRDIAIIWWRKIFYRGGLVVGFVNFHPLAARRKDRKQHL